MSAIHIAELQRWVGRSARSTCVFDGFPVRALASLLEREQVPADGDPLPMTWHWLYFNDTPRRSEIGPDGHPRRGGFLPPVPLPRRMWAAGEVTVEEALKVGKLTTKVSTIESVELKDGRSGPLVFVTLKHVLQQAEGGRLVETQDLVYREIPNAGAPLPPGAHMPVEPDWSVSIMPDADLLFRYSALTYNGHRIHYDRLYAAHEEHYPGLVVHGPLLATFLLDSLQRVVPFEKVIGFRFRALRPTFDGHAVGLCGKRNGKAIELWTTGEQGFTGMTASAVLA